MSETFEFSIKQDESKPMGGTELIYNRVMERIDDKLKEEFIKYLVLKFLLAIPLTIIPC